MAKTQNGINSSARIKSPLDYYHVTLTFLISFSSFPICYVLNYGFTLIEETVRPFWMLTLGSLMLVGIILLTKRLSGVHDWIYYGVTLFAFTCLIDLIISLEYTGFISGFMSEYLKFGEPYLHSPWGNAITLFDGFGFYVMYLGIAFLISNGKNWRSLGIYWASGIINSMVVLLIGVLAGRHDTTFCTFFNVPYVVFPVVAFIRAWNRENRGEWSNIATKSFLVKVLDIVLVLGFAASIWICIIKGVGAIGLGSNTGIMFDLIKHEKVLIYDDPAPFPAVQNMVQLFYLVPIQGLSLVYSLKSDKPRFLYDITLVHAGTIMQSQFTYIVTALDPNVPGPFQSQWNDSIFWFVNLLILAVPHLFLYRLSLHSRRTNSSKSR